MRVSRICPVGDRQRLEILKVLYRGAKVLILDEPTAVLTPQETQHLFEVLARLRDQGTTGDPHHAQARRGDAAREPRHRDARRPRRARVRHRGHESGAARGSHGRRKVNIGRPAEQGVQVGDVVLEGAWARRSRCDRVMRLKGIDIALRAGQIVGVAGVSGNGQSELLEVLSGLRVPQEGVLTLAGETFSPTRWLTPRSARRLHLAHVPEDRHARAMVMDFPRGKRACSATRDCPRTAAADSCAGGA
jgi:simple sugar transport system ATP-binding protein